MSTETAEKTVDLALADDLARAHHRVPGRRAARQLPRRQAHHRVRASSRTGPYGKQLEFTMVSNLSLMDEEKLAYLVDNKVQICTSIDGPEHLHDKQRKLLVGEQRARGRRDVDRAHQQGVRGARARPDALPRRGAAHDDARGAQVPGRRSSTRTSTSAAARIFLRPVDPFGFAEQDGARASSTRARVPRLLPHRGRLHPRAEPARACRSSSASPPSSSRRSSAARTRTSSTSARPCGAAIGQLAYNYDGKIFTSDEGRMLHEMGDSTFLIGDVHTAKLPRR